MKKKNLWSAVLAMGLAATLSVGFVGCSDDDEPTPEIVTDNPLDKEVYYIAGKVTDGSGALEGVEVGTSGESVTTAADGSYQLQVTKKGTYAVTFSKQGYVTVSADAVVASDVSKHGSVFLSPFLVTTATPVTVTADKDTFVYDERSKVAVLAIPAGAVKEDTEITVTEYLKGAKSSDSHASLSTINCTPDGQKFEKEVEVTVKNATSNVISFADVKHLVEDGNTWKEVGDLAFDPERNVYVCALDGFSNHSFGPAYSVSEKGKSGEKMSTVTIDNLGKMQAVEQEVSGKAKKGWEVKGNLQNKLGDAFPGLSNSDLESLTSQVGQVLASMQGSPAGVEEMPVSIGKVKVDGDQKVTIDFEMNAKTTVVSINFNYKGNKVQLDVEIITYAGSNTIVVKEGGASHPGHSGGTIG